MSTSNAAHKPSDIEAQFRGETRAADGYQYWTTSTEDEEALDIRSQVESGVYEEEKEKEKKKRAPLLPAGTLRRTGIRLAAMVLVSVLAAAAYFGFTYYQVSGAASTDETQDVEAIIVLGAAQYDGVPSNVLQERLDHAFNLYREYEENVAPTIIVTADADLTSRDNSGYDHLIGKGVAAADIELIDEGDNSWEQLSAAEDVIESKQFDSVLLVSDSHHNFRLQAIANDLDIEAYLSPSAVDPDITDYLRESAAVSIGRITGYSGLNSLADD